MSTNAAAPLVSLIARITDRDRDLVTSAVEDHRSQDFTSCELILIDATTSGGLTATAGATIVRERSPSVGAGYRRALAVASGRYVAWLDPRCCSHPSRIGKQVRLLEADPQVKLVTCDVLVRAGDIKQASVLHVQGAAARLPGFWHAGVMLARETLETIAETAFYPVALDLYERLQRSGAAASLGEPLVSIDRSILPEAEAMLAVEREQLAARDRRTTIEEPETSVIVIAEGRAEQAITALDSLCRQALPQGTYEVVLVDCGAAGLGELIADLRLPVVVRYARGRVGERARALNQGLALARGSVLLFLTDQATARPGLLREHLRRHTASTAAVAVLGTLEPAIESPRLALQRCLHGGDWSITAPPIGKRRPHPADWTRFTTAHVSVPKRMVLAAGGFDEALDNGAEDLDLAVRLSALGVSLTEEPSARAVLAEEIGFAELKARRRSMARSLVKLIAIQPQLLDHELWHSLKSLTLGACEAELAQTGEVEVVALEHAAQEIARTDVATFEQLGVPFVELAGTMVDQLSMLLMGLDRVWWLRGLVDGMYQTGTSNLAELQTLAMPGGRGPARQPYNPWRLLTESPLRFLAWPRYDAPDDMDRLMSEYARVLADRTDTCLCLRHDPFVDGTSEVALQALEEAHARILGPESDLNVLMIGEPIDRGQWYRLGQSVGGWLALPSSSDGIRAEFFATLRAPRIGHEEELRARVGALEGEPQRTNLGTA